MLSVEECSMRNADTEAKEWMDMNAAVSSIYFATFHSTPLDEGERKTTQFVASQYLFYWFSFSIFLPLSFFRILFSSLIVTTESAHCFQVIVLLMLAKYCNWSILAMAHYSSLRCEKIRKVHSDLNFHSQQLKILSFHVKLRIMRKYEAADRIIYKWMQKTTQWSDRENFIDSKIESTDAKTGNEQPKSPNADRRNSRWALWIGNLMSICCFGDSRYHDEL